MNKQQQQKRQQQQQQWQQQQQHQKAAAAVAVAVAEAAVAAVSGKNINKFYQIINFKKINFIKSSRWELLAFQRAEHAGMHLSSSHLDDLIKLIF